MRVHIIPQSNNRYYVTKNNNMNCSSREETIVPHNFVLDKLRWNFAGVASSAILPVKLSAFAVKLSSNSANIMWTTDMETNSNRFEIERSFDGISWIKIADVKSKGNSSVKTDYFYTDVL